MLDFKKLAEVTSIEELPEGINVLVNDNGVVKQVPANKVGEMVPDILKKAAESGDGFGYTDGNELHQIDSKYIKREELVPEELSNAIETHGMGYTNEEEVPAINIAWDGNIEDREHFIGGDVTYVKVADAIFNDISELYGAKIVRGSEEVILDDNNCPYDEGCYILSSFGVYVPIDDGDISEGLYFIKGTNNYTSSLTKEASTQEVVHQIDQKYIPSSGGGGSMMVNASFTDDYAIVLDKTYEEISSALPNVTVNLEGEGDFKMQYILPYTMSFTEDDVTVLYFSNLSFYQSSAGPQYAEIKINSSNEEVEFTTAFLQEFTP